MPISILTGFLKGYGDTVAAQKAQQQRDTDAAMARDSKVFETLLGSDDPEISGMALTGLLGMSSGKYKPGKGLADYLGVAPGTNPDITALMHTLKTGGFEGLTSGGVGAPHGVASPTPAVPNSAAMAPPPNEGGVRPEMLPSPTAPAGGAPTPSPQDEPLTGLALMRARQSAMGVPPPAPTPAAPTAPTPTPATAVGPTAATPPPAPTVGPHGPRKVFLSGPEREAKGLADAFVMGGEDPVAAWQRAAKLVGLKYGGASLTTPRFMGNVSGDDLLKGDQGATDAMGQAVRPGQQYRHVQQGGTDLYYAVTPTSAIEKPTYKSMLVDGKAALVRIDPDHSQHLAGWVPERASTVTVTETAPDGSQVQRVIQVPPSFSGESGHLNADGSITMGAPSAVGTPPPPPTPAATGAAPAGRPAATASSSATPGVSGGVRTVATARTKPTQYKDVTARLADGVTVQSALELHDGTLLDRDTRQPLPAGAQVVSQTELTAQNKLSAQEQQTLDSIAQSRGMIARVRQALSNEGITDDNGIGAKLTAFGQGAQYAAGFQPSSPTYQSLIPLVNFLKVFLTTPYLRGIRNGAYIAQIQQHLPASTDTPALITEKLNVIDQNMNDIERDIHATPQGRVGGPPPNPNAAAVPGAPSAATPVGDFTIRGVR